MGSKGGKSGRKLGYASRVVAQEIIELSVIGAGRGAIYIRKNFC
jgi:hypothetical protein